ncbi:DNA polymerase III subunit beta [Kyrpidia spormannii]|uniref:DNA polymerase III (Beta subunit) n=2 Tax=Kyrpidia spormannii TaxID=2055160 RepID=A0ACA8Z4P5_9BACL|nr:DNA polymerase III subunit beta [Kyrpidia spormannii]CAB3389181.1 DNA polymerase III (beta subunit) [Kyrpidia spormannii]CAB3389620.1 DNA polymerase III (beta subunit) [Kyrpidia spormannii]
MRIHIHQQRLGAALQQVQRAVSAHSTMPILGGIKLTADVDGLRLMATNHEIAVETYLAADSDETLSIEAPGSIVLPARYFVELVRKLPDPWVHLAVQQPYSVQITSAKAAFLLHGFDPEEFPRLPQITSDQPFLIYSDNLKDAIRQTVVAIAAEETRPVLTGLCMKFDSDSITFIGTDSHRLASRKLFLQGGPEGASETAVVPGKSVHELARLLPEDDTPVAMTIADNTLLVSSETTRFFTRLLEGQYPDTSKIIPTTFKTRIHIRRDPFASALERALLIAREMQNQVVRLQLQSDRIELSAHSHDVGRVSEQVPLDQFSGDALTIAFNGKYMLDAVRSFDGEQLTVDFTGTMSPMVLRPTDGQEYLHLVLPVRTV